MVVAGLPILLAALTAWQPPGPSTGPAAPQSPAVLERRIAENLQILTGNNEPRTRVVGARELLALPSPAAWDRAAAILKTSSDTAAQIAICQAIANGAQRRAPLVDPLIELLGAKPAAVSQAAALAICRYKDDVVVERLAALAADADQPEPRRLAAISALGAMGDAKPTVSALIPLLDDRNPGIVAAVLDKIDDSSDLDLPDVESAKRWWEENRELDQPAWLQRRNEQLRTRIGRLETATDALTVRLLTALRTAYRGAPEADRDRLLLDILNDPLAPVRGLGVELVDAMITDRKPVPKEVAARLATLVDDPNADVRRQAAAVVGDLRDKELVPRLTGVLAKEADSRVRAALIAALGRIGGIDAEKAVQSGLDDPSPLVIVEAATALGALAERNVAPADVAAAASAALRERYERLEPHGDAVREAFLAAMARIAAPEFRTYFVAALGPEQTEGVRRAAIRGLAATDEGGAAETLRPLLEDASPAVRLAAAEGLGRCGKTEDDLAALDARLDPLKEPEEAIRGKAWEGVGRILKTRPLDEQLTWADRFYRPDDKIGLARCVELLTAVEKKLADQAPVPPRRFDVLERLGDAHAALGQSAPAASFYEQAAGGLATADASRARRAAGKAFGVLLTGGTPEAAFALLDRIRTGANGRTIPFDADDIAQRLETTLSDLLSRDDIGSAADLARRIARRLPADLPIAPARREALDRQRLRAIAAGEAKRVNDLVRQVASAAPESDGGEARAALVELGGRALPALLAELERRAAAKRPIDAGEQAVVATIRQIEPRWPGYAADADAGARRKALAGLRSLLPQSQPSTRPTTTPTTRPTTTPAGTTPTRVG